MSKKRVFRILVCTFVICSLLINCSPIKAEASMITTSSIVSVAIQPVVISIIKGLGVTTSAVSGSMALVTIADSCIEHLQELGLCREMTIDVFGYTFKGYSVFGITSALIEVIRSWLFDEQVLVEATVSKPSYNGNQFPDVMSLWNKSKYKNAVITYNDAVMGYVLIFSSGNCYVSQGDNTKYVYQSPYQNYILKNGVWTHNSTYNVAGEYYANCSIIWTYNDLLTEGGGIYLNGSDPITSGIFSPLDVSLGEVATSDIALSEGYSNWHSNSVTVQDPETKEQIAVMPIPQVYTSQDALGLTQQQIWEGITTGTGTDTDSGTTTDPWSPPSDPGAFALDLTNYFPFCIPFDLYDFLSCLAAEPEAPVISWELPIPGGSTFPIELDLSPFDPVAQLLRRLELLLFIVGLAIKTRDLIKG